MYTITTRGGYRVRITPDRLAFIMAVLTAGGVTGITLRYSPIKQ